MDDLALSSLAPGAAPGRPDRLPLLAFMSDAGSESVLREGLSGIMGQSLEVRRGNVRSALRVLGQLATPESLIVDITGEDQPLSLLADLRHVVEPDVKVMVVGERQDVTFYRQLTRTLGAAEYLYKPLSAEMVARHFGVQISRTAPSLGESGGRLVCLTGARGGCGTTTLAANLAWYLAETGRRHTILLDADLQRGTAAMLLGGRTGPGLRSALESPDRVDELFLERSAMPLAGRLHLLAAEEPLAEALSPMPGAVHRLTATLRRRFNYVVADVPFGAGPPSWDLLSLAQQRVIVLLPTLGSIRDTLRLLALPAGAGQARRAVLVLNRLGMSGGMSRATVEQALGGRVDVCVPDLPRLVSQAESLGEAAVKQRSAFRTGIEQMAREIAVVASGPAAPRRWWRR